MLIGHQSPDLGPIGNHCDMSEKALAGGHSLPLSQDLGERLMQQWMEIF